MRRNVLLIVPAVLALALHPLTASAQSTGRSLDIQPGARENGMGAAGVALMGDPTDGLWWNPAMLAFGRQPGVDLTYAKLVPGLANDVKYWHGGATAPIGRIAGVGIAYTYLDYGSTYFGNDSREDTPAVSAAISPMPDFAVGATLKRISIKLSSSFDAANGTAFDLGALWRRHDGDFTVSAGAMLQNMGPEVSFGPPFDTRAPLTRNVRFGVAGQYTGPPTPEGVEFGAAFAVDRYQTVVPGGGDENFGSSQLGAEVSVGMRHVARLALRAGYYDDVDGQIQDPTFGAGVRIVGLAVDFAAIPQAKDSGLDRVKKWTFGYHFDRLR